MFPLKKQIRIALLTLAGLTHLGLVARATAQTNVDPANNYAWGENIGWTNWHDANAGAQGAVVGFTFMTGFLWGENVGWINLGDGSPVNGVTYANLIGADAGVNIDSDGTLHGLAWGENIGWVNFDGGALAFPPMPARIDCATPPGQPLARLTGFVWGENVGWINLDDTTHFVSVDAATTPIPCDTNHDGLVNGGDVQSFIDFLLLNNSPDWRDVCSGDVEAVPDKVIELDDVANFVDCLLL